MAHTRSAGVLYAVATADHFTAINNDLMAPRSPGIRNYCEMRGCNYRRFRRFLAVRVNYLTYFNSFCSALQSYVF